MGNSDSDEENFANNYSTQAGSGGGKKLTPNVYTSTFEIGEQTICNNAF